MVTTRKILSIGNPGDATHWGSDDTDFINQLLTAGDQSATAPVDMNTIWKFRNQKLKLANPLNTFSSTVINPTVTADANFQFNIPFDYYIFIDPDDSNIIKCRNGRTGAIVSTHATNADVPIKYAQDQLTSGGAIFIGPGTFNIAAKLTFSNNIHIVGSGRKNTKLVRTTTDVTGPTITLTGPYMT